MYFNEINLFQYSPVQPLVARLTTYLDLASALRFKDPVQLQVKSYISNRLISKLRQVASYLSHHNAMAYDTPKYSPGAAT
jgi:hypothetical protein